jgi:hypothetical protein
MNACTYCGSENDATAVLCRGCGAEMPPIQKPAEPRIEFQPRHLDLAQIEGAFAFEGGFSRPQWDTIGAAIETMVDPEDQRGALDEAAVQWLQQIGRDLGGDYCFTGSENFLLLSAVHGSTASNLLGSPSARERSSAVT